MGVGTGVWFAPAVRRTLVVVAAVSIVLTALAHRARALQIEKQETAVATPTYVALGNPGAQVPDLACNDSGCLAIRIDSRTGTGAVWGLRLRPDGAPQDPAAFLLSRAPSAQASGVATDGSRFMVAWGDGQNLYTTWVDPDGSTSTQTVVMGNLSPETGIVAIAYGDQGYLMAYVPGDGSQVLGLRLDRDGHALDTQPFLLSSTTLGAAVPAVVWTGAQYLVVWNEVVNGNGEVAKGARVLADGTVLDPGGFMVTTLRSILERPQLAWSGGVLMMVAGPTSNEIAGIDSLTLDADGKNPHPFSLPGTGSRTDSTSPDIAWNGTDFVVTWMDDSHVVTAARVSENGTAVDTTPLVFTTATNEADSPRLAVSAGRAHLIYAEVADGDRLHGVTISANGSADGGAALVDAASAQVLLAVARGDGQTLIVWTDKADGQSASLQAARVADNGGVLDTTAQVLGAFGTQSPRLAGVGFASGTYLVAWWDAQTVAAIRAARVSTAGMVLDATPILVANPSSQVSQIAVGYDGQAFVVSWSKASSNSFTNGPASARRIGLDGTVLGNVFTFGPTTVDMTGAVLTTQNNGCIAAWGQPDFPPTVAVAAIGPGGVVAPTRTPAPNLNLAAGAAVVPVGTHLLLWEDRVGAIIDATDPFTASGQTYSLPRSIGTPTWDGMMFVAATPSVVAFALPPTGIDVSAMGSDGTLAAPITLSDRTLPVWNPTPVGLGNGRSLLVYSRLMPESDFGNYQVRFQILNSSTPGDGGTVLDAGMDRAPDASDGGVVFADASSFDAGSSFDGGASDADANPTGAVDASGGDLRADSRPEPIDGPVADRRADAGPVLAGSGCSCAIEPGRDASWASIAVALALLTARRRRRSRS
jgi:MYXO-CTERM domain-containing protein